MSIRLVSAGEWNTAKGVLNMLLTDMNAVHVASSGGTITPAITLEAAIGLIGRTMAAGVQVKDDEYADSDGIVAKYNLLRKYESCRIYNSGWTYGYTVTAAALIGHRTASFPAASPDYITPPTPGELIRNFALTYDMLEIVTAGCAIHRSTVLVGAGSEYVTISICHSSCHTSCHGDCRRSKR